MAKDQQCQEKSITYSNRISRKKRLDNSSPVTSCDGANKNNNREFRQPPWFRLTKSSSQGADVTNRPVQNSKTACVILICFFFSMVFFFNRFQNSLVEQLVSDLNLVPYF